ncbi:MAG: hypothetical protein ACLFVU_09835 [Phycisphaerae bacterium]
MADDRFELKRVDWKELFAFTHIFKSFRLAIHPSKVVLALATILLVYIWGSWILDGIWALGNEYAKTDEIALYAQNDPAAFAESMDQWEEDKEEKALELFERNYRYRRTYKNLTGDPAIRGQRRLVRNRALWEQLATTLEAKDSVPDEDVKKAAADKSAAELLRMARTELNEELDDFTEALPEAFKETVSAIEKNENLDDETKAERLKAIRTEYQQLREDLPILFTRMRRDARIEIRTIRGVPIFDHLLAYEDACAAGAIRSLRQLNFLGGIEAYAQAMRNRQVPAVDSPVVVAANQDRAGALAARNGDQPGFLYWVLMGCLGLCWLISAHPLYALLLLVFSLAVWALFGGAIHRIAALHSARDEKISMGMALKFSLSKFVSFFTAPLIPLVLIVAIGLLVSLGGLLGNIPYIGELLIAILFILPVLAGLIMAFLTIGLVGGFGLMYPTIAVEGSDSFDAISRSFSYIFARPWRTLLYAVIALVYGVLTYLFVRLFVYIALAMAHWFLSLGVWTGGSALNPEADKIDVMWTAPTFDNLYAGSSMGAAEDWQGFAALIIGAIVFIVAASVWAYALSFFASASTTIYYLLRKKVDATDVDDVYIEEEEEEFPAPAPAEPSDLEEMREEEETESEAESTPEAAAPAAEPEDKPAEEPTPAEPEAEKPDKPEDEEKKE